MATELSYYDILGVTRDANADDIKSAYRQMAKALHPDKNKFGAQLMKRLNEANEVLSDAAKRLEYDRNSDRCDKKSDSNTSSKDEDEAEANKRKQTLIRPYLCVLCNDIVKKEFRESSCCASLCCVDCLVCHTKSHHLCPNEICKKPLDLSPFGSTSSWVKGSKFTQKQIDSVAPTHLCGRNVLPEDRERHNLVCPKFNTKCFKCSNQGKLTAKSGDGIQCDSCKGLKYIPGLDWTKCFKCKGKGASACNGCLAFGALQGVWTKCFKCKSTGSYYDKILKVTDNCSACQTKGALCGDWTICFKCNGLGQHFQEYFPGCSSGSWFHCNACNKKGALIGLNWIKCFKCKGRGGLFCTCKAMGALQGKWTKCFKCESVGWVNTEKGGRNNCDLCNTKGALEGFNLQACHLCEGVGCEKCSWKGAEKCKCGVSCKGHSKESA